MLSTSPCMHTDNGIHTYPQLHTRSYIGYPQIEILQVVLRWSVITVTRGILRKNAATEL